MNERIKMNHFIWQSMAPKLLASGECTPEDLCFSLQVRSKNK